MKNLVRKLMVYIMAACLMNMLVIHTSHSAPIPREDSWYYYEIGGARAIHVAPNPTITTVTLSGSIEAGLGYSCGKFDPTLGVTNILNDISNGVDTLVGAMVTAATAAIAALPALLLQRANPGLYDLMQNSLLRAEATIALATQTCEQMEKQIREGKNPFEEWITISKGNDWKSTMGTGGLYSSGNDAKTAKETVESNNGRNGVSWPTGAPTPNGPKAGGFGQPPIRITGDTVLAGYNMTLSQPPGQLGAPTIAGLTPRVVEIWPTATDARNWLTEVIGDDIVRTAEGGSKDGMPGYGLIVEAEADKAALSIALTNLVSGVTAATPANLEAVSSPTTGVTRQVLEAIKRLTPSERGITVDRLASEISMQRVFERASLARRLLITGKKEPNIIAAGVASDEIDSAIERLESEIEMLLYESRAQKDLVADTLMLVLKYDSAKNRKALGVPAVSPIDSNILMTGGGVSK